MSTNVEFIGAAEESLLDLASKEAKRPDDALMGAIAAKLWFRMREREGCAFYVTVPGDEHKRMPKVQQIIIK